MIKTISLGCALCAFVMGALDANARPQRPTLEDYGITKEQQAAAAAAAAQGKKVTVTKGGVTVSESDGIAVKPEKIKVPIPPRPKLRNSTCPLSKARMDQLDKNELADWRRRCDEARAEQKRCDEAYEIALKNWQEQEAKKNAGAAQTKR